MATGTSSSSLLPIDEEDEILMLYGSESGWVEAKTHCDHLASLSSDLTHIPTPDTPCNRYHIGILRSDTLPPICIDVSSYSRLGRTGFNLLRLTSLLNLPYLCQHPVENWLCLCCKEVLCSRFVNKHMLEHYKLADHSLALSFSDLSVWCFSCNAYLDVQVIMPLQSVHFTAYVLKFNEPPPLRAVECVHITDNRADGSSTSGK